jgi:hypothetical protein
MAITPPTYTPSGSLFGSATPSTPAYTYGNLGNTTSAYNLWGSKGNPYIVNGPSYTPGAGAPINPQPVAPVAAPINNSGGDSSDNNNATNPVVNNDNGWYASKWATEKEPGFFDYSTIGMLGKASLGINPTSWGNKYFGYYSGPGAAMADNYGIGAGEQRDMLIDQEIGMWDTPQEENAWHSTDESGNGYSDLGYADYSTAEGTSAGDYAEAGFSKEDMDFANSFDDNSSSDSSGGGSYIATAATNALGKEGLDMFEGWRDYMHTAHPTFTTSYGRYRVTAPKIVSAIDKKENSTELYQDIWNEYLKPIFNLIKKDMDNPKALSDYKVMVRELTNKYLKGDK